MNALPSLRLPLCALTALLSLVLGLKVSAQSVTTVPVGAVTLEALANSDSYVSVPLVRPSIYEGVLESKNASTLILKGAAFNVSALQYQSGAQSNTYYIQIASGAAVGHFSTIISNSTQSVVCEYEQDILDLLQVGDRVVIRPYWTLGTLFPAQDAGKSFIASLSNFTAGRRTEIIFPDEINRGINKSAKSLYFFNQFWRKSGNVGVDSSDTVISPDTFFVIRGNGYSQSTNLTVLGSVQTFSNSVALLGSSTGKNDNPVGIILPRPMTLQELGLVGVNGVFAQSTNNFTAGRGDELILLDNSQVAKNKSAAVVYFYNSFWRKSGDLAVDQNNTTIPAGSALIIRKKQGSGNEVFDWKQPSAYTVN